LAGTRRHICFILLFIFLALASNTNSQTITHVSPANIIDSLLNRAKEYSDSLDINSAIMELKKAEDEARLHHPARMYDIEVKIADTYLKLDYNKEGVEYLTKALNYAEDEQLGECYLRLADATMQDLGTAKKWLTKLKAWREEDPSHQLPDSMKNKLFTTELIYKIRNQQIDDALGMCGKSDLIGRDSDVIYNTFAEAFKNHKNYLYARILLGMFYQYKKNTFSEQQTEILQQYQDQLSNSQIETEKNRLRLQNANLELSRMQASSRMLEIEKEKDNLQLINTDLELKNVDRSLKLQKITNANLRNDSIKREITLKNERQNAEIERQRLKFNNTIVYIVIGALAVLLLAILFYLMQHRKAIKSLNNEMVKAKEARDESERLSDIAVKAQKEAQEEDENKNRFIQNMSHEIRTPLNAIVGFTEILSNEKSEISLDDKRLMFSKVHENTDLLTKLLNDILLLSHLESGSHQISIGQVRASDICIGAVNALKKESLIPKGVELTFDQPVTDYIIETDNKLVTRVLFNYLDNSCKFTKEGSIRLTFYHEDDEFVFAVTDTGCGIPEGKDEHIFEKFEKADEFTQGAGLGLSINKAVADMLHGEARQDKSYHDGARFLFTLPDSVIVKI